jgi:Na+/H+-dicarboxylate symporter
MTYIAVTMVLGMANGVMVSDRVADHTTREELAEYIPYGSMIFLRLIKVIIAPPVVFTLLAGLGHRHTAGPSVGWRSWRWLGMVVERCHKNELAAGGADCAIILPLLPHWEKSDA